MAGNLTIAYASLADLSSPEEKVRNFALIPFALGLGFALGPYLAGVLANPDTHALAGPALPLFVAALFSMVNLGLVWFKFPETLKVNSLKASGQNYFKNLNLVWRYCRNPRFRSYLGILFLMISSNLVFVQFLGPFAIEKFNINVTEVGYLYANIGISLAIGHIVLSRQLPRWFSIKTCLRASLFAMGFLLIGLVFSFNLLLLHCLTSAMMLACAVAYTNAMALVSNRGTLENQGEIMGVAVSVQSCSEFLPAVILGTLAFLSQSIPLFVAAICAFIACGILSFQKKFTAI